MPAALLPRDGALKLGSEAGQSKEALGGAWHSHNTSGICDVTVHLSNEISNYNTLSYPHTHSQIRDNALTLGVFKATFDEGFHG